MTKFNHKKFEQACLNKLVCSVENFLWFYSVNFKIHIIYDFRVSILKSYISWMVGPIFNLFFLKCSFGRPFVRLDDRSFVRLDQSIYIRDRVQQNKKYWKQCKLVILHPSDGRYTYILSYITTFYICNVLIFLNLCYQLFIF